MKAALVICVLSVGMWGAGIAAEDPAFDKASLGWRTALHFDPGGEAPLQSLVQLYQRHGRVNDLVNLYAQHVAQFPQDVGAKVVLARLYVQTADARGEAFLEDAVKQHPGHALLVYTRAQRWVTKLDPRAVEELDRAVALETDGSRRAKWLGELLELAATTQREDLAVARFDLLAKEGALPPGQRLQWARRALEVGLTKCADVVMRGTELTQLRGDEEVEARFVLSRVALALGRREDASRQAADLLERLAPDHWRYKEAVALRWQSAVDGKERDEVLAQMEHRWQRAPQSEAAALSYGEVLATAERKDEALKVWRETLVRLPESRMLEERILELLEQLRRGDDAVRFLTERTASQPGRADLELRKARSLLLMGRMEEGLKALGALSAQATPDEAAALHLQSARWLRARHLVGEAARVMEALVAAQPDRWDARKELAELFVVLKRGDEMQKLFEREPPDQMAPEVRLEVAQFLAAQKLWAPAQRLLSEWLEKDKAEFEGRLLLARVYFLLGDEAAGKRLLDECRELADTDARYAAWLAVAWERAGERESTQEFLSEERQRLWPKQGEPWDAPRLAKLSLLAQQTMQPEERADAEKLLRQALAAKDLPPKERMELRLQLIQILTNLKGREADLEAELKAALAEPDAAKGDLQLRLAVMYADARRHDLARAVLAEADAAASQDTMLIRRAVTVAEQVGLSEPVRALQERLVRLQPDERAHWIAWSGLMMDQRDEAGLRLALREIQSRAKSWELTERSQEQVRRHLAASYWRSVGTLLARDDEPGDWLRGGLSILEELERLEMQLGRQLWALWARAMLAKRLGETAMMEQAISQIEKSGVEWVDFPDGLSLPVKEAGAMIRGSQRETGGEAPATALAVMAPLQAAWVFTPPSGVDLQRWDLTPSGDHILVADTRGRVQMLERKSGKLLWQRRLPSAAGDVLPVDGVMRGGENLQQPPEWAAGEATLTVLSHEGLHGLSLRDGQEIWRSAGGGSAGGSCVVYDAGLMLWWRPVEGRVEAYHEATGKLTWSRDVLPPWKGRPGQQGNPQWIGAGIHAEGGRVLAWAGGGAVLRVRDGAVLWKARLGEAPPAFPLDLSSDDAAPSGLALAPPAVLPWITPNQTSFNASYGFGGRRRHSGGVIFANAMAAPGFGFPGMYGNSQSAQVVTWGIDDVRRLSKEGIWRISNGGVQAYSLLGLPLRMDVNQGAPMSSVTGFYGNTLVGMTDATASRWHPLRGGAMLWTRETPLVAAAGAGETYAMPAAALAGSVLLLATRDTLRAQDVVSGAELWQSPWPEDVKAVVEAGRESMKVWQSQRWSGRGVFLNDNQRRTLVLDWKSLAAGGDWIVPAGTRALVCLRGAGGGVKSANENGVSN